MDTPPDIWDVCGTWLDSFFFWNRGLKTPFKRMKIEGSLTFHTFVLDSDSQAFRTCYFCSNLIYKIFQIFHLLSVTSGIVLQNGVCEWVVSKDRTLIYDPVRRFTRIQYRLIFVQITGLVFSFSVFKFLLSSLWVFFPVWGSRCFLISSGTHNQRARTSRIFSSMKCRPPA